MDSIRSLPLRLNLLANAAGRAFNALSLYLFVPLYLRYLGIEAYGVVGFYAVLQGILAIADMGFTATLNREMAWRSQMPGQAREMRTLVRSIEILYWTVAIGCALGFAAAGDTIAVHWIRPGGIGPAELARVLKLMGWAVALQLPATLYQGGILGLQKQVAANAMQITWNLGRNGGVVLALVFIKADLTVFFTWQLAWNLMYSLATARFLWASLPLDPVRARFSLASIRAIWKYAAGMAGLSILSVSMMQVDKMIVSKLLTLKEFGYYALASMIAQAPMIVTSAIAITVFPKFAGFISRNELAELRRLYRYACRGLAVAVIPACLILFAYAYPIILFWTRSASTAENVAPIARWFILGSLLLALQVIPYHLALAHGHTRINLIVSAACLVLLVPMLLLAVRRFSGVGGAMAWFALNLTVLPVLVVCIHRKFMSGATFDWLRYDFGLPMGLSLTVLLAGRLLIPAAAGGLFLVTCLLLLYAASVAVGALSFKVGGAACRC